MTIGVYCIENTKDGKKYVGKSINMEDRIKNHKYCLRKGKHHNAYLQAAYDKHGKESFEFYFLEILDNDDQIELAFKEMGWIDKMQSIDKTRGYNLLYDSPLGYVAHEDTRKKKSESSRGKNNPNYGNNWTDEQKQAMSQIAKARHSSGEFYNDEWKAKISKASSEMWKDDQKKRRMAESVSESKSLSDFYQYRKDGKLVAIWKDIHHVLRANPEWKWQNIYAACNGSKGSYQGFIWKRKPKTPGKWMFYDVRGLFDEFDEFDPFDPDNLD